jgi:hypothetical protein
MSAKHFIALASVLRYLKDSLGAPVYKELCQAVANYCASENDKFKRDLFMADCGLTVHGIPRLK